MEPDAIDEGFRPSPAGGVETLEVDGELLAVVPGGGALHRLNPSAALVWRCLDGIGTVSEIAADLADGLGVPADTMRADIVGLVRELATIGLLEGFTGPSDHAPPHLDSRFVAQPPST